MKVCNCEQTNDYYQIVTLNHIIEYKFLVLDRNTWNNTIAYKLFVLRILEIVTTNDYRQIKVQIKKMQWNIENIVMITIKYLQINQILALNNP